MLFRSSELAALLVAAAKVEKTTAFAQAPFDAVLNDALVKENSNRAAYRAGQKFGAWTLEECIGAGGMGEVWRAKRSDGLYKASAALKLLRSGCFVQSVAPLGSPDLAHATRTDAFFQRPCTELLTRAIGRTIGAFLR